MIHLYKLITTFFLILSLSLTQILAQSNKFVKVEGSGLHDGSSWENAFNNIEFQINLRKASNGTTFYLSSGTYYVIVDKNEFSAFLIPSGVKIRGGFSTNEDPKYTDRKWELNKTILSGNIGIKTEEADNVLKTVVFDLPNKESLLDGVYVEGGITENVSGCNNGMCDNDLPLINTIIAPPIKLTSTPKIISTNIENLSRTISIIKKGLNYSSVSQRLGQRFQPLGIPQPAPFIITDIPQNAIIEKVFIWAEGSGNGASQSISITTPTNQTSTYPMTLVGSAADKCWISVGYSGSHTYRADITSIIKGNGIYLISGLLTGPTNDMDGATILVIWSDPNTNYQGSLTIDDGAIVIQGGYTTYVLTIPQPKASTSNAKAFIGIGDLQHEGWYISLNDYITNYQWNWWNFIERTIDVSTIQTTSNFYVSTGYDCINIAFVGLYYQTPLVPCTQSLALSSPTDDYYNHTQIKESISTINATNKIDIGSNIKYKAGSMIILDAGFKVNTGASFETELNGCN